MSYEGRGVSDHRKLDISSSCSHCQHEEINILHYWFFVNGIHRWPVRRWKLFRYFNIKAADDDPGKLLPVFLKRLYLLHICIFSFFSFQRQFNNHLKILTTTIWSTISRFYHCYFILRWNVLFFTFLFSTRKRLIRFHFFFLQDVW